MKPLVEPEKEAGSSEEEAIPSTKKLKTVDREASYVTAHTADGEEPWYEATWEGWGSGFGPHVDGANVPEVPQTDAATGLPVAIRLHVGEDVSKERRRSVLLEERRRVLRVPRVAHPFLLAGFQGRSD